MKSPGTIRLPTYNDWDKKRDVSKAEKAGRALAKAIIEMIHLMYRKNTAWSFLVELLDELEKERQRRARQ